MFKRILDRFLNHLLLNIVFISSLINIFRDDKILASTNVIVCWIILAIIILSDKIDELKKDKEQK